MGFNNPDVPWRELERQLSGRPSLPDANGTERRPFDFGSAPDGGDSPAWSRKRDEYQPDPRLQRADSTVPFADLHAHSSFSFLDGSSGPERMVEEAVALGLEALAITDHDGFYGIVRFAEAASAFGLPTVFGAELNLDIAMPSTQTERMVAARAGVPDPPGRHLLTLARGPAGYASLSAQIAHAHRRGGVKGRPIHDLDALTEAAGGDWTVLTGCRKGSVRQALESAPRGTFALDPARRELAELVDRFGRDQVVVELTHALDPLADERYEALVDLAAEQRLAVVATTGAHYAAPDGRPLATATAAVRARSSLDEVDGWLPGWADAHLRSGAEMLDRFARWPGAVSYAAELGRELAFPLKLVAPDLPPFPVPPGMTEMTFLRQLALDGARRKWGTYDEAAAWGRRFDRKNPYDVVEHELRIIDELNFPGYFLVVWDIVQFCKKQGILCQGRGSAANSAVCYAIDVTAVDAVFYDLLFERFLAPERDGAPDIDIDIESDRREEAIQHVYDTYGRDNAAQVANVITYRPKSAVRDVAKALGHSPGQQDAWSKQIEQGYYWTPITGDAGGKDGSGQTDIPLPVLTLAEQLQDAPRHLGIHSGGMVICDRPVIEVCPVEWGRMPKRTVLQWDKDDCAEVGLVKFDLLGLGMLSALHYAFELIEGWYGRRYDLDSIPKEDPRVYDMLCAADSVGVFQVESRAQMATLPRLKPRKFYDLCVEVALIRPGPIQGDSVHPYIRRLNGLEAVTYPHPSLENALRKTLGIPLFQEQLMQIAIDGAGFTPAEADQLRRAMGSKRSESKIAAMKVRLYEGMERRGITGAVADSIYEKVRAFAAFGFAESHSISFALLVYASSWLKLYHPAAFCAALINAQPMGFYSPQSLAHDAKRHGVVVRGPDLDRSLATASLEAVSDDEPAHASDLLTYGADRPAQPAVRLGLADVTTISDDTAEAIVAERNAHGRYRSLADLVRRTGLKAEQVEALATAGACDPLSANRREALWTAGSVASFRPGQLDITAPAEERVPELPVMSAPEQLMADLWSTGVTDTYPTALIRPQLDERGCVTAADLKQTPDRTRVLVGGVVTHRQRPATASGTTFVNLEDETGMINVICSPVVWARYRRVARDSAGLLIRGMVESEQGVVNVVAEKIERLPMTLRDMSRNFR
ncbi:error-prone DNA polymerase [Jatrophihabitans sp. YIM 134969]